jgi:predicted Rossmann fold flavoprotein
MAVDTCSGDIWSNVIQQFDAIVLGAGAAGMMCAIEAGRRGRRVAVVEHADRIGKKILISGGGRCNFTNIHCSSDNFLSANPHFCKSALARYTPEDFLALIRKHKIPYHEKTLGQLFCDRSAQDVITLLEAECRQAGVQIFLRARVTEVSHGFEVRIKGSDSLRAPALVVATGGLSIPKIGATPFGYQLAQQFGLRVVDCRPALVPLVFGNEDRKRYCDLAGVASEVIVSTGGQAFRERMLITHKGLSGPAVLQVSSYWAPGQPVNIDLAPKREITNSLREEPSSRNFQSAKAAFRAVLPHRLADRWVDLNQPSNWTNHALEEWERKAHAWEIVPAGTEGYEKAEVTAGGIDTEELSSTTMESKKVPGLFFIGEVVDVTGQLGGFNFQWAWASGACAGRAL